MMAVEYASARVQWPELFSEFDTLVSSGVGFDWRLI